MRNFAISALVLAAALSGGAAMAQSVSPGVAQLAAIAGVSSEGFTQAQLTRLINAQRDGDQEQINFILSQQSSGVSRSDMGGTSAGAAQLANSLGVEPGRYTLDELLRLDRAMRDDDTATISFIVSGEARKHSSVSGSTAGGQQLAAALGVNAADYSLAELTSLYAAQIDND
ncbi:hypothetical protein [Pseudotabrizicola sp. L79]|uniref:hypothetical protein n=1 Tax=Pseudotabrizicola sp. L79 TaxID=3118402 RepID=UPI002F92C92B